jgi:hypothetical protein
LLRKIAEDAGAGEQFGRELPLAGGVGAHAGEVGAGADPVGLEQGRVSA